MTTLLTLDGVTLQVSDGSRTRRVLRDVRLDLTEGDFLAVMGPSGSGKTSLLSIACGLVTPTAGQVSVLGQHPPARARRWWTERRRRDIGAVYQRLNLVPGLTALENVVLPLELDGISRTAATAEGRRALEAMDIAGLAGQGTDLLSVGEQQLVAIARGMAGRRRILLADEPTAALDRAGADLVVRQLARVAKEGRGVLMVTHSAEQAAWADRVIEIQDGRLIDEVVPVEPTLAPHGAAPGGQR